jgi:hypothetical protein
VDDDLAQPHTLIAPSPPDAGTPADALRPALDVPASSVDAATPVEGAAPEPGGSRPGGPRLPGDVRPAEPVGGLGATTSQLRRFIKSRPWVPMHELRRRFGIEGPEDEMALVDVPGARIYVGLPPREASLLGDLIRQGEVGYELVHDPDCPAVAGVYPMRPVVRT